MSIKKFLIVVDQDVAGDLVVPGNERYLPLQEALQDTFTVIEVSPETSVVIGQTYDGTKFVD